MNTRKYLAFISYSHANEDVASRIHREIERYRTPRSLRGTKSRDGVVPARLFPVFRDREELPTSSDLGQAIRTALENSRYLIVLCSVRSAQSHWVNEEILQFKRLHGEGRILAVILDGEPGQPDAECFPPALAFRMNPDGTPSSERTEPIAADLRPGKDGWRLARLKILAGLLGVNLDDLTRREKTRQRKRRAGIAIAAGVVLTAGAWAAGEWRHQRTMEAARTLVNGGIADLRGGDTVGGAHRLLAAVRTAGAGYLADDARLISTTVRRLLPLAEALPEGERASVMTWRDHTYVVRRGETPVRLPVRTPSVYAWANAGAVLVVGSDGGQLHAFDGATMEPLWSKTYEGVTRFCGIWQAQGKDTLYVEGEYIGSTAGDSIGLSGLVGLADGAGEVSTYGMRGSWICTGETMPSIHMEASHGSTAIGAPVTALAWPRVRREGDISLWIPEDAPPHALFLEGEEFSRLNRQWLYGTGLDPASDAHAVFACGGARHVVGVSGYGMGGGTWETCSAAEDDVLTCTPHDYRGSMEGVVVSPGCDAVVAFGGGIDGWTGLMAVQPSGDSVQLPDLGHVGSIVAASFSGSGARFAAADNRNRLLIFESDAGTFNLLATHELDARTQNMDFLSEDRLAVFSNDLLRSIDVATGADIWPPLPLLPGLAQQTAGDHSGAGVLVASTQGHYAALVVSIPARVAYALDASLQPRLPDGSAAEAEDDEFVNAVWLFDMRRGVPLGSSMALGWIMGRDKPSRSFWNGLRLIEENDHLVLRLDDIHALKHTLTPLQTADIDDVALNASLLTGLDTEREGAPLQVLPGARDAAAVQ